MIWFWYFLLYSFIGFLLEVLFAWITGGHPRRKCLLLLPLCPVYGLGACLILGTTGHFTHPLLLFCVGAVLSTACEYIMATFYEEVLLVSFWDYSDLPLNLHGRVCLPFALVWGGLTALAVRWVQPMVERLAEQTVPEVTYLCLLVFAADALCSLRILQVRKDPEALRADVE